MGYPGLPPEKPLQGLTLKSLKKHTPLIPIYFFLGAGMCWAAFYLGRLAFKNPEVTWNSKKNPEPWEAYRNKQYKFWASSPPPPCAAPTYKE